MLVALVISLVGDHHSGVAGELDQHGSFGRPGICPLAVRVGVTGGVLRRADADALDTKAEAVISNRVCGLVERYKAVLPSC